jgi:uncharacterized protein (DUF2062 family)
VIVRCLMLREYLQEALDLIVVGSVVLVLAGAFLLIVVTNRLCLLARRLRSPAAVRQAPQGLYQW